MGARHILDPDERARYRKFDRPDAAAFFALRRAARRLVLSDYLQIPPDKLRFAEGRHGRPAIAHPESELQFSASDTGQTGMIAITAGLPLGLDIEGMRTIDDPRLAERILSPVERQARSQASPSERNILMLRAWTGKEAIVKGMGLGLDLAAFRQITLALDGQLGVWRVAQIMPGLDIYASWYVCQVELGSAPCAAAAVSVAAPSPLPIRIFDASLLLERHGLI